MLVLQCGMIHRGAIAWAKVSKCLEVAPRTIRRWLDPLCDLYKEDFAKAVLLIQQEVEVGKVKLDTLTAAGKHIRVKTFRVARTVGPKPPKAAYRKEELIEYAASFLKPALELHMGMTKPAMLLAIQKEVENQTKVKMVKVATQEQEVYGEPAARAMVLANHGPVAGRWTNKEGRVLEAGDSLKRLFAEIGDQETVLPSEELGLNDAKRTGSEYEEPVLATKQPVLDNESRGPTDEVSNE